MMEIQQVLLCIMDKLCFDLGKQMSEGFPAEADRRQEENNKLRYQMNEGFEAEQQARCQVDTNLIWEMALGFKSEDCRKETGP